MEIKTLIEVQCEKVSLTVKTKVNKVEVDKTVLKEVTTTFKPGRLTAIMGASGAGKTTLLSLLAGDSPKDARIEGSIMVNGAHCPSKKMKKISGFVFQDDVLFDTMTVYECIMMSARLRLPDSISLREKEARAEEIIKLLSLEGARNTIIGSPEKKGISGGERKRTAIAMEMITNPDILFLDEPTSGLDTFSAYNVVSQLRKLAQSGRTVVATIHQPSSKTFKLFDDLILMAEGQIVYYGPADEVLNYLAELDFKCPEYMNPADFLFMDVLNEADSNDNDDVPLKIADVSESVNSKLIEAWRRSSMNGEVEKRIKESIDNDPKTLVRIMSESQKENSSGLTQFKFLLGRGARNAIRNKMVILVRLIRAFTMGVMIASIYYDLPSKKGFAQIQDRMSALFFICTIELFSSVTNSLFQFAGEKTVFLREYRNGFYGIFPYFLAKSVLEIPIGLFTPLMTVSILYPMVGFRSGWYHFGVAVITAQLMSLTGAALGLLLGGVFPNFEAAMAIMPAITMPMMIFGGLQVNLKSLPWYFKLLPYLSPVKWAYSCLTQNEWTDFKLPDCQPNMPCTGAEVLRDFSLDEDPPILVNWLVLVLMFVVNTAVGLFFSWRATRR